MNKTLIILILSLTFTVTSFSQINWRKGGNNQTPPGQPPLIGTNASWNAPLQFITFGTERMRLTQGGLLGIGTTTPTSLLEANGNTLGTGEVFRTNSPNGTNTFWRMFQGNQQIGNLYSLGVDIDFHIEAFQDDADIVFHTNYANTSNFPNRERMRIGHGTVQPGIVPTSPNPTPTPDLMNGLKEVTRVTISEDPANPIRLPLSLLHIGFSAPGPTFNAGGFRDWMDIGTYTASSSDNMYVGMRAESPSPWGDQQSAVISWGNNPAFGDEDRLRFIFTSQMGTGLTSAGQDGLEMARMVSNGNRGRMGIGDFFTTTADPQNTLEIRSNIAEGDSPSGLRFSNLTSTAAPIANPGNGVLALSQDGDVIYVDGGNAGFGLCPNPTQLTGDAGIDLNGNNFYFEGPTVDDKVGIGVACGTTLAGKLTVSNTVNASIGASGVAGAFLNTGTNPNTASFATSVVGVCSVTGGG